MRNTLSPVTYVTEHTPFLRKGIQGEGNVR